MGGDLPAARWSYESRDAWRARRRTWRRRTRLTVLSALVLLAAGLSFRGVAPHDVVTDATSVGRLVLESMSERLREAAATGARRVSESRDTSSAPATQVPEVHPVISLGNPLPTAINSGAPLHPEPVGIPRRVTENGCCAGAWWSSDGSRVYYLRRPEGAPSATIYEALAWPPGVVSQPADLTMSRGVGAVRFTVRPIGGSSQVEDRDTGDTWHVGTGGSPAHVSGDGGTVTWWEARGDRGHFDAEITVYAEQLGSNQPRELVTLWGANVVGYLNGDQRVLVTGRPIRDRSDFVLATLDAQTGELDQLAKGKWLSDAVPSPSGDWVAYMVSLDSDSPEANGLWIVGTNGEQPRKLPFVGAYRWRGDSLVYAPQLFGAASDELWEVDAPTMQSRRLFDPATTPIRIANNDWSVAPNGGYLLYRSAVDLNLWIVRLDARPH